MFSFEIPDFLLKYDCTFEMFFSFPNFCVVNNLALPIVNVIEKLQKNSC